MTRKAFLTFAAAIALSVGFVAALFPAALLASKSTVPSEAANLWMSEVGVLLVCVGVIAHLVRSHSDSQTMKALMCGNLLVQLGLFGIEVMGYFIVSVQSGHLPLGGMTAHPCCFPVRSRHAIKSNIPDLARRVV
ncbi:MAG: hypothetical protein HHJ12_12895 [Glaciimonas sp.]|nr:hypothetical protein [Glaciimonas sp.]